MSSGKQRLKWFRIPFDLSISEEELFGAGLQAREMPSLFFLGKFTETNLSRLFNKSGLTIGFNKAGYEDLIIWEDTRDPYLQRLALYNSKITPGTLLFELIAKIEYPPQQYRGHNQESPFLKIEWLSLQNPSLPADKARPLLPGQIYPGTGMAKKALQMVLEMGKQLKAVGISIVPEFFHNALFYSRHGNFLDPQTQGRFNSLARDLLKENNVHQISWAVEKGLVIENNKSYQWATGLQVLPISSRWKDYFQNPEWKAATEATEKAYRYQLLPADRDKNSPV